MLLAALLAAASAAAPAPKAPTAAAGAQPTLDMVPAFIGACMANGPDPDKIRATVVKAGGKVVSQPASTAAAKSEVYTFPNQGAPYSVIFDQGGTCLVVTARADIEITKASLDRLVIGSSKVFDISQTEGKPHAPNEKVIVEYRLTSKNKKGGMELTLSRVTETGKGSAVFLTRRIFNDK